MAGVQRQAGNLPERRRVLGTTGVAGLFGCVGAGSDSNA